MTQVYLVRGRHGVGKLGVTREARFGGFRYAKLRPLSEASACGHVSWLWRFSVPTSSPDEHWTGRRSVLGCLE